MALALNKILIAGANSNTAGAYFTTQTLIAPATVAGNVVPAGVYLMFPTLNSQIYANNGTALVLLTPANTGGVVVERGQAGRSRTHSANPAQGRCRRRLHASVGVDGQDA